MKQDRYYEYWISSEWRKRLSQKGPFMCLGLRAPSLSEAFRKQQAQNKVYRNNCAWVFTGGRKCQNGTCIIQISLLRPPLVSYQICNMHQAHTFNDTKALPQIKINLPTNIIVSVQYDIIPFSKILKWLIWLIPLNHDFYFSMTTHDHITESHESILQNFIDYSFL